MRNYDDVMCPGLGKPTDEDGELVLVKELRGGRVRRSTESTLPRFLHMQFSVAGESVNLQLERNTDIERSVRLSFANKNKKTYISIVKVCPPSRRCKCYDQLS